MTQTDTAGIGNACCIRNEKGKIVFWCRGYSEKDIDDFLKLHPDWHRSAKA